MKNLTPAVDNLSLEEMLSLTEDVLKKEGYSEVKKINSFCLLGNIKAGLVKVESAFIIYQEPLSGIDATPQKLKNKVDQVQVHTRLDNFVLVTNQTVSNTVKAQLQAQYKIEFIERDDLIELINIHFPNFWTYRRYDLAAYEKYFLEEMVEKSALLNIQGLENRVKRLLDIYIKPRVYEIKDDLESSFYQHQRVNEKEIVKRSKSCIIEGDTGSGKTTLLKEIGRLQIQEQTDLKTLPIFISPLFLSNSGFNIQKAAFSLINKLVNGRWDEIKETYNILLLIDNIDEFDNGVQTDIVHQLNELNESPNIRYILTTRSIESNKLSVLCEDVQLFQIWKFNDAQIKEFAVRFFKNERLAENLLSALEDNRILQRLPLTPMSLSLISLVFEKENYEIPATISDIYDNFNQLILGKITATKRFEIINFAFRERILSIYAFHLLQEKRLKPLRKPEFIDFCSTYFKNKSSFVETQVFEDFLDFLISNSGILNIVEEDYVQFSHRSFLEYYASLEVFKHNRQHESLLIDNFLNLQWQNVAIFYAGQSKDMPDFLREIMIKAGTAKTLMEYNISITGLGYLLQALYQTDNNLRKQAVLQGLEHSLVVHNLLQQVSTEGSVLMFKNARLPFISIFNMYYFYLNFLSSTLSQPLELAFDELWQNYLKNSDTSIGYQLLTIAAIFNSPRIKDTSYLSKLFFESNILKDPVLVTIAEFSLYFDSSSEQKKIKKELKKSFDKLSDVTKTLLKEPANKLRFTSLDTIQAKRNVILITEGPTDVQILIKAFKTLTDREPYWEAKPAGIKSGGAAELKFTLDKSKPLSTSDRIIIGIFDNDTEGRNQFKGLNNDFSLLENNMRIKKMNDSNIYGIKLPIPVKREEYANQENEHHYFSIEHYFDDSILEKMELLKKTGIPGIFKIKDTKSLKTQFARHIQSITDPQAFQEFIILFQTIDNITGQNIDYHIHL